MLRNESFSHLPTEAGSVYRLSQFWGKCREICQKCLNERREQRGKQLSGLFNERKNSLCRVPRRKKKKKAWLESASGLAELQIHFNMRKCESEKRGEDVRHSRDGGERAFYQISESCFFLGSLLSPFSYDAMRERQIPATVTPVSLIISTRMHHT